MQNARQIQFNGYVIESEYSKPAQVGIDLSVKAINKVGGGEMGRVLVDKTILGRHTPLETIMLDGKRGYYLEPGCYDFVMNEGCNIPLDKVAFIKQRSSLMRNGALMQSSLFDPGFKTDNIGSYGFVFEPIFIEQNARIAQMYFHECTPIEEDEAYKGQWQNDKQRA